MVILHSAFGTTGTAEAPFHRGRTATHEIGHWLNLFHIWGDDFGCTGTDHVDDTPNAAGPNRACPTFPRITCNNGPNGDMFMNYMDYVDDPCMVMFTAGQVLRMQAALDGPRSTNAAPSEPPAFAAGVSGTPSLIQSGLASPGNFEVVAPQAVAGMAHFSRNNSHPGFVWSGPTAFGQSVGQVGAVSLIQSNIGSSRNFEVVARIGNRLAHFWRNNSNPALPWSGPTFFATGVSGTPSLIQGGLTSPGNFELVVPLASGGMAHYSRNNSHPGFVWSGPTAFGQGVGQVDSVSLIQSNLGNSRNFEVVARIGNRLAHFWRNNSITTFPWSGPTFFATGVSGNPALIQSGLASPGNFEVVVPLASGGMAHYWRNNSHPGFVWSGPTPFGQGIGQVGAVSLIQSNIGTSRNFEVVARNADRLSHFWRNNSNPAFPWSGPHR